MKMAISAKKIRKYWSASNTMIKKINKLVNIDGKAKWITVIYENEKTISDTITHLRKQNPFETYCIETYKGDKE